MRNIVDIADEIRCSCPHCGRRVTVGEAVVESFHRMIGVLMGGERVRVMGFGTFRLAILKGRSISRKDGSAIEFTDKKVLKLSAAQKVRRFINREGEG